LESLNNNSDPLLNAFKNKGNSSQTQAQINTNFINSMPMANQQGIGNSMQMPNLNQMGMGGQNLLGSVGFGNSINTSTVNSISQLNNLSIPPNSYNFRQKDLLNNPNSINNSNINPINTPLQAPTVK
jgi:hypothetical protein